MDILKYYRQGQCVCLFRLRKHNKIVTLGSSPQNDYQLESAGHIEEKHIEIQYQDGKYYFRVTASVNVGVGKSLLPLNVWLEIPQEQPIFLQHTNDQNYLIFKMDAQPSLKQTQAKSRALSGTTKAMSQFSKPKASPSDNNNKFKKTQLRQAYTPKQPETKRESDTRRRYQLSRQEQQDFRQTQSRPTTSTTGQKDTKRRKGKKREQTDVLRARVLNQIQQEDTASYETLTPTEVRKEPPSLDFLKNRTMEENFVIDNKYRVVKLLGKGGMGTVYETIDEKLKRRVALKILNKATSPEAIERFFIEAQAVGRLNHPNIVSVHDIGLYQNQPYFTMDIVRGQELQECLAPFHIRKFLKWMLSLCEAMHYVHENGIIHRDLKPANVMIAAAGPILTDFGIVRDELSQTKLTAEGQSIGTPSYMSPEQARGQSEEVDRRADVYGLGAILYEMLTSRPPFTGPAMQVLYKICFEDPVAIQEINDSITTDLAAIVEKAMAKEKELRYQTAQEMAEDIQRYLDGLTVHAKPQPYYQKLWRYLKSNRSFNFTLKVSLIVIATIFVSLWVHSIRSQAKKNEAIENALKQATTQLAKEQDLTIKDYIHISEEYNRVLTKDPDNNQAIKGKFEVLLKMGKQALDSHDYTLARIMYDTALGMNYDNARAKQALESISQQREKTKAKIKQVFASLQKE